MLGQLSHATGDVSPADGEKLIASLKTDVDGVQVDFDDGHCPTWTNQLKVNFHIQRT